MNDLDFKEEQEEIINATKASKTSLITFIVSLSIALILYFAYTKSTNMDLLSLAIMLDFVAAISWICFFVFKYKELKLLIFLAHKRLDELAEKYESMNKN